MNTQIKLYVDRIIEFEHNGTYGFEFDTRRIIKDIFTIFNNRDATDFLKAAMQQPEGISYMHIFCQFIVFFHLRNDLQSGSLALFDCWNDMDIALDMYNHFTKQGFDIVIKQDFMNQFLELQDVYELVQNSAKLTLEPLIIPYA